jgi:hypothetical protein
MPCGINCPKCKADGTELSNAVIARNLGAAAAPAASGLRINRQPPAAPPVQAPVPPPLPPARLGAPGITAGSTVEVSNSLPMGILGALLGAALGAGLMYGFFMLTGFRFPLLGVGIGMLTGYGARLLFKGTDSTLGGVAAAISLGTVVGVLYLMFGEFPMLNIISVIVGASMAYRIAS